MLIVQSKRALNNKERVLKMKKFLVAMLMLMVLCVAGCDGKKAESVDVFAGEVVVRGETLGKPISDKRAYTYVGGDAYEKVFEDEMLFRCTEVDGKISAMTLMSEASSYEVAMSFTLKMMAEHANKYNDGVYLAYGGELFVTRYKGNNIVAAVVQPNDNGHWTVSFTLKKLSKNGFSYIKYIEE